ncbi:hypothetical protein GGQ90_002151, partial [Sphingobium scionense]|nr:hypothetical protein [Sphingobium scionense]
PMVPHSKVAAPLIQIFTALGILRESDNAQVGMTQTLTALANGHPANRVHELMPWIAVG